MTGKEYLLQARYLDERIHSKIQQIESLNDLATSCSSVISDMPKNPNQEAIKWQMPLSRLFFAGRTKSGYQCTG